MYVNEQDDAFVPIWEAAGQGPQPIAYVGTSHRLSGLPFQGIALSARRE